MTKNNIGKNLYWVVAVYVSCILFAIIILALKLIFKHYSFIIFDHTISYLIIFLLSYLLTLPFVRYFYYKIYEKYMFDYANGILLNIKRTIEIDKKNIKEIYIGFEKSKKSLFDKINYKLLPHVIAFKSISRNNILTIVLDDDKILFLPLFGLEN